MKLSNKKKKAKGILPSFSWLGENEHRGLVSYMHKHPELFEHIKQNYKGGRSVEDHIKDAEKLAVEHDGILPNYTWLKENGYLKLTYSMIRNPELFKHIKQDKMLKSSEEHVKTAEQLSQKHGGVLPCSSWLKENGHIDMIGCMWKYPELFAHIEQERRVKSHGEHVKVAEKLAKNNGGILPNQSWLRKNGGESLRQCMRSNPELFKHIKQEKLLKTSKDHVDDAENLAKNNDGILPRVSWLQNNDYSSLDQCMRSNPELFEHIKQDCKQGKSPEESIKIAEKLAKNNGGILPNHSWLRKNGYEFIIRCKSKHPQLFKSIKQKALRKSPEENVKIDEQLAKNNDGILPSQRWLKKNGHCSINNCVYKYPDLFKHIKRIK